MQKPVVAYLLRLPWAEFWVYPDQQAVETRFRDGKAQVGLRADTAQNRQEAEDQGYHGEDAVWHSLRDHELLHHLVSSWLWDRPSPTLRHEAGGEPCPYGKRLYEEALVIAMQRFLQTGDIWPALSPFAERLERWRARFGDALRRLEEVKAA